MRKSKDKNSLDIGAVLRQRREALGLSQEELADLSGLHRTYIGGIERGERNITVRSLSKIAGALQLKLHDIFERLDL